MKLSPPVVTLLAATALAAAAPAAAQARTRKATNIEARIDAGLHDGSLTWKEGQRLRRQLYAAERAEKVYWRGGLTRWEARNIQTRYDLVSNNVRDQRHDAQMAARRW